MSTSITTINTSDLITNSRSTINDNFSSLNSNKIETSYIDTDTTLAANSDSKIATQKAVKTYVDTLGNVNASTTAKGIVEQATDAEVVARTSAGGTGAPLFVNPSSLSQVVHFGGTGADGALSISSGTTTIDLASAAVLVKNYTSISITGTGKLAFSNPNANGTIVVLKSQGNVTLTSSTAPMLDCSSLGAPGGAGASIASTAGIIGSDAISTMTTNKAGNGGDPAGGSLDGVGGVGGNLFISLQACVYAKMVPLFAGAGGGGGGTGGTSTAAGAGGRGGGGLYIECGGAWNFTTASGISVAGATGVNGTPNNDGGGGGGAGGSCVIFYSSLTANSGTITVSGGTGGTGTFAGRGGGGGGNPKSGSNRSGTNGGNGATGLSLVSSNTDIS